MALGDTDAGVYRKVEELIEKTEELIKELEKHRESSNKYSGRLFWLTWALVALTAVLILQGFHVFELLLNLFS